MNAVTRPHPSDARRSPAPNSSAASTGDGRSSLGARLVPALRLALAAAALLTAALLGFRPVFSGTAWLLGAVLFGSAIIAAVALLSALLPPPRRALGFAGHAAGVGLGSVAAWLILLTATTAPETAPLGLIPTGATLERFAELTAQGQRDLLDGRAPVVPSAAFTFLILAAVGVVAIILALLCLSLHAPVLAAVLAAAVYVSPILAISPELDPATLAALAAAILWVMAETARLERAPETRPWGAGRGTSLRAARAAGRRRTLRELPRAAAIAAAAILVALLVPPLLPALPESARTGGAAGPGPFAQGINPMLALGEHLTRPEPSEALSYTTDTARPLYLKVLNIVDFSGDAWGPSEPLLDPRNTMDEFAPPPGQGPEIETRTVTTEITVSALSTGWLPLPFPARGVTGLDGEWSWEPRGLTARSERASTLGQSYTVESLAVLPSLEQLRAAPRPDPAANAPYLALPEDLPASISRVAAEVTAGAATDYDRALALQRYFRGEFRYSEDAPVENGFAGNGMGVIEAFIERRSGYCVHFASAMAVMARDLSIPARIAVGYLPGVSERDAQSGTSRFVVSTNQLHAWPELYFEGIGWIPFEPTASRGTATSFLAAAEAGTPEEPEAAPEPSSAPAEPSAAATQDPGAGPTAAPDSADNPTGAPAARMFGTLAVTLALLALAALIAPALRRGRARARLREGRARARPAGAAWSELEAILRDLDGTPPRGGLGAPEPSPSTPGTGTGPDPVLPAVEAHALPAADTPGGTSPRALRDHITGRHGSEIPELNALLDLVEAESYAAPLSPHRQRTPESETQARRLLTAAAAAVREDYSRPARLRAWLLPSSLLRRSGT